MIGNLIDKARSGLHAVAGGLFKGARNGLRGMKNNWFGVKKPVKAVSNATGKVANYLHVSKRAVSGALIASLLLGSAGIGLSVTSRVRQDMIMRQDYYYDDPCKNIDVAQNSAAASVGNIDERQRETAWKIWGVLKSLGWTDEACAGLLGCMNCESGVDPTKIESLYSESYTVDGPKHRKVLSHMPDSLCDYTTSWIFGPNGSYKTWSWDAWQNPHGTRCRVSAHTGSSGKRLSAKTYGSAPDGHFYCGIGLVQNTGNRAYELLRYAEAAGPNHNWYDLDVQMAFLIDDTGGDGKDRTDFMWCKTDGFKFRSWGYHGFTTVVPEPTTARDVKDLAKATRMCDLDVVGHKEESPKRVKAAEKWYNMFRGTKGDQAFAQSVIELANTVQGGAQLAYKNNEDEECKEEDDGADNSDIARAAVSYAFYEISEKYKMSNGTDLYRFVHDNVHNNWVVGGYYMGCDVGVSTAVRWSDADPNFCTDTIVPMESYMKKHKEMWKELGPFGSTVKYEDLQPGDILITTPERRHAEHGHVVVYVSNEIVKEKFPDGAKGADFVSASVKTRAPMCQVSGNGRCFISDPGYVVFRLENKNEVETYKHITDGMNWDAFSATNAYKNPGKLVNGYHGGA